MEPQLVNIDEHVNQKGSEEFETRVLESQLFPVRFLLFVLSNEAGGFHV